MAVHVVIYSRTGWLQVVFRGGFNHVGRLSLKGPDLKKRLHRALPLLAGCLVAGHHCVELL